MSKTYVTLCTYVLRGKRPRKHKRLNQKLEFI